MAAAAVAFPRSVRSGQDALFEAFYSNLRAQALFYLHRERKGHLLSPTVLVHETYMSLSRPGGEPIVDPEHFIRLASRVMRNWLTDWARRKNAIIHGGGLERVGLDDANIGTHKDPVQVIMVADAMTSLEALSPDLARVVELTYFCGFDEKETALAMDLSPRHIRRLRAKAQRTLVELIG